MKANKVNTTKSKEIVYKAEQNKKYGDWRVNKYVNGELVAQKDNNWVRSYAEAVAKKYNEFLEKGADLM